MANDHFDVDSKFAIEASRPVSDMKIAREIGEVFTHMLEDGRSVIDPATTIWTAEAAEELRTRIGDNPIVGKDQGQWEKLDRQLQGASREVVLLAAELVFLREHAIRSARPETRKAHVDRVLAHLDTPLAIPAPMSTWLGRQPGPQGSNRVPGTTGHCGDT